jgi:hypothetical protein
LKSNGVINIVAGFNSHIICYNSPLTILFFAFGRFIKQVMSKTFLISLFELLQETHVVFEEEAQVVYLVFQHGDAFYSHSESKSGVFTVVYITGLEHVRINHAATENFDPTGIFTDITSFTAANIA